MSFGTEKKKGIETSRETQLVIDSHRPEEFW